MKTYPHENEQELRDAGIVRIARPAGSYTVKIAREPSHPGVGEPGDECWVARDVDGDWRSYCGTEFSKTAVEAVSQMFHANEVLDVEDHGKTATAQIA